MKSEAVGRKGGEKSQLVASLEGTGVHASCLG